MTRLKKIAATSGVIASLTAVQIYRPATMDTKVTPQEIQKTVGLDQNFIAGKQEYSLVPQATFPQMALKAVSGASNAEIILAQKGTDMANQVLKTLCFKSAALNFNFSERAPWSSSKQLTNQEIYDLISKTPVTFKVSIFTGSWWQNHWSKTMGYDIGDGVVYMNRYFVHDAETMGSLMIHEAEGHGQGFHHYSEKSTSIPYKWNDFFDQCLGKT